ncbi:acylneuraminate cytidylyltransferase [Clostridium botulinum]|uniref:Acylneuraminate cytidylyltransferase n=1 Tax=Clostridium botulinum TaxID=1491 RepID=A0A9Q1ZC13_CLOBO|nr:acylneuraminate cytidylyltransferase family protein [Clostridium botulinum]AEB75796.1 N-acylneuraminate cytidylyltransferase [Clostridium botulinum BKT015925]KEH98586.1 acylneuraminate cytidylyltransferase [Clostridium botulinum D str. 16868]KEI05750.1 acylneuraminate cytidylyltransferase [Clostridium botulinum C/D str. Sp77]KLU75695.1 acylneuraminate cytidylyltransferase [Clostridium botulinum V891]KOA75339.1 acylneuraminate cytidylyltransferase [Clostridium botulinum]
MEEFKVKKKILAIVPARGGSKGVKKKNLRILGDKPLINWTLDEAKKSKFIDRLIVSTEDDEIQSVALKNDVQVVKRPLELAKDESPTIDAILHALDCLEQEGYVPDYIILLQCTVPFRKVEHIDEAILRFMDNISETESLISVTESEDIPYWYKSIDDTGVLCDFLKYDKSKYTRRQDFEKVYKLNGAIYITKLKSLYDNKSFESDRALSYIMDKISSIDIDTEFDLEYVKFNLMMEKRGI